MIDILIRLSGDCQLVPILGNHDEMMLKALDSKYAYEEWLEIGGITTLDSYEAAGLMSHIPPAHFDFLRGCRDWFENDTHFFVHGNYDPQLPLDKQDPSRLRWLSLRDSVPGPHVSARSPSSATRRNTVSSISAT